MAGPTELSIRPPAVGDGKALAELWHTLWHEHEAFGGYPHSRDPDAWADLATRLDATARLRGAHYALGQHLHIVAAANGRVVGQVEGWIVMRDRRAHAHPRVCEVRSLVVRPDARGMGLGAKLLDELGRQALAACGAGKVALAAEVFELNEARGFYEHLGYRVVAHTLAMDTRRAPSRLDRLVSRAVPAQARAYAALWSALCRERSKTDPRFLPPPTFDACAYERLGALFASEGTTRVFARTSDRGELLGAITVSTHPLEMPFSPNTRACATALVLRPCAKRAESVAALLRAARAFAHASGATRLEIADLAHEDTALVELVRSLGGTQSSRTVIRFVHDDA